MSIQKILNNAAKDLQKLVEKHKNFVKKITKIIKRKTLDSHFLVRSVETGFSYDWGEVGKDFNKKGLSGLHVLMKKNFSNIRSYDREFAKDVSFWAILAYYNFDSITAFGKVLQNLNVGHSPIKMNFTSWKVEDFLDEVRNSKSNNAAKNFAKAMKAVESHNSHLPRYRNRFYYSILRNTNMLYNEYDSSFEYFLKKSICSDNPGISWKKLSEITIEEWNQIKPWKKLFGIAEDIFFYILRDIKDFKDTKYLKLDKRNLSYFNKKELWCIAGDKVQKNNKTAYEILEKINSKIKKKNPEWPYSIGHLNAAIYAENL